MPEINTIKNRRKDENLTEDRSKEVKGKENGRKTGRMPARILGLLFAAVFIFSTAGSVFAAEPADLRNKRRTGPAFLEAEEAEEPDETEEAAAEEQASSYYASKEHADMDYADMVYTPVDPQALNEILAELDAVTDGSNVPEDPEQRTVELYREILEIFNTEYTNYVLGDIAHYMHVNDEELSESNRQDTLEMQDMSDAAFLSLQKAMSGPYGSALLEEFSDEQLDDVQEYEALTDHERELIDRETELQQKYDQLSEQEFTFEYKGKTWTMDDLFADQPENYDDVVAIYLGLSKEMNKELVPVFQDMVKIRREIAETEEYDTYTDYCYDVNYGRDFTGEDIAALRETIIQELKPLYEELRTMQYMSDFNEELAAPLTGEEIVDTLAEHMDKVHPDLTEAFEYLREHKLYCIDSTDDMVDVGFTSDLPAYGSAFIFDKTGGTIHDLETIVHEFGHFNAAYHAKQNVLMDSLLVDVAEIQSQGLEMLFLDEMQEILPDDPEGLQLYMLVNMLDSVLTGFEYDEFQQEVYAGGDMTREELNRLAMDIDSKYTQYFYDDDSEAYEWVLVNHTFTSPLYYIGYATSALSALDIWTESLEDRDAAVDKYMKLSAVPLDMPYQEATTSCGLRNMLDPESIRELADEIRAWAGQQSFSGMGGPDFPEFDLPFGFDEDGNIEWNDVNPMEPFLPDSGEDPVVPYEYETVPYGYGDDSGEDDSGEYGYDSDPDEYEYDSDPDEYGYDYGDKDELEELIRDTGRQAFKAASYTLIAKMIARIVVLIIALSAFFRKRRQNTSGRGGNGYDDWGNTPGNGR